MCPKEHLQRNIFEVIVEFFKFFGINNEVYWTAAKSFLHGCQNWSKCPGEQIMEKPCSKEKNLLFFKIPSAVLFFTISAKARRNCQNCYLCSLGRDWRKTLCESLQNGSFAFRLWDKKVRLLVKRHSSGLSQLSPSRPEENFEENYCLNKFVFLFHSRILATTFLSLGKETIQVCQNNNQRVQKKNVWKINRE